MIMLNFLSLVSVKNHKRNSHGVDHLTLYTVIHTQLKKLTHQIYGFQK